MNSDLETTNQSLYWQLSQFASYGAQDIVRRLNITAGKQTNKQMEFPVYDVCLADKRQVL